MKKENENPSVGIILCSSKDKDVVEYSLSENMKRIGETPKTATIREFKEETGVEINDLEK